MDESKNIIWMMLVNPLFVGFLLDLILGDPLWFPHPVRLLGRLISIGEEKLNHGKHRVFKGGFLVFILIMLILFILVFIYFLLRDFVVLHFVFESLMIFYGIANRNLIAECLKVERKLKSEGLEPARKQLSMIVGRDTQDLTTNQIRTATLETLSENLSDGVIAPMFYYVIGGIPFMFVYKMVNTLDSMIAYKNERYILFGKVAAMFDDIMNFIPARLTALIMVLISFSWRGIKFIFKYGHLHSSPNAGYPEAALAGILNCRFGGSNIYHNNVVEKPFIGYNGRTLTNRDLKQACVINFVVTLTFLIIILLCSS